MCEIDGNLRYPRGIFMKKVTYSISIVVVVAITLISSGCGEDEVSINTLKDSPDDYIRDRVRVTG